MDESWRMRMGMPVAPPPTRQLPNYPPRRSTESTTTTTTHRRRNHINSDDPLNPEDFTDVFGGPPKTILSRQFSSNGFRKSPSSSSSSASFFYEEIFRPAAAPDRRLGRSLPEFRIPGQRQRGEGDDHGFYSDIFGWPEDDNIVRSSRSRSRSKASSSSVLSSEELSPLRPPAVDVSFFASKLRPINVKSSWSSIKTPHEEDKQKQQNMMPPFSVNNPFYNTENHCPDDLKSYPFGSSQRNASPETISIEPISNGSFRVSADDDVELNSPSSSVSSVTQSSNQEQKMEDITSGQNAIEEEEEEEDDEDMSSYVIEINSDYRDGTCESNGVDEAIAWAKEKFQTHVPEYNWVVQECGTKNTLNSPEEMSSGHLVSEGHTDSFGSLVQTETQILDEKIRLWSTGKETDIRLLLSSLHHILWPNSGWCALHLMNVIEISQVKKAYQKARLCLHPDKLQQRGATISQKYVAKKAFLVLQDAWAVFVSQNVL